MTSPPSAASDESHATAARVVEIPPHRPVESRGDVEERLLAIGDYVPGVVYSYDKLPDGTRIVHYLGPGLDDLIGPAGAAEIERDFSTIFERIHPEDAPRVVTGAGRAVESGERYDHECRLRMDDGGYRWIRSISRPIRRPGGIVRWHVLLVNIEDRKRNEFVLRTLLEATSGKSGTRFFDSTVETLARVLQVRHVALCEHLDHPVSRVRTIAFWQDDRLVNNIEYEVAGGPCELAASGAVVFYPDAVRSRFPRDLILEDLGVESYCAYPLSDSTGRPIGHLAVLDDRPMTDDYTQLPVFPILAARAAVEMERRRAEEQLRHQADLQRLLFRELDHRVRNNLASLLGLISLTRRTTTGVDEFAEAMRSRIGAMARIHTLLSQSRWASIDLVQLIHGLRPVGSGPRIQLDGPNCTIAPVRTTAVGMVLHELMTNSEKYGALGSTSGRVEITWAFDRADTGTDMLTIDWREHDGPEIDSEPAGGLGTSLIEGLVRTELHGTVTLRYPRGGAHHCLRMSLEPTENAF